MKLVHVKGGIFPWILGALLLWTLYIMYSSSSIDENMHESFDQERSQSMNSFLHLREAEMLSLIRKQNETISKMTMLLQDVVASKRRNFGLHGTSEIALNRDKIEKYNRMLDQKDQRLIEYDNKIKSLNFELNELRKAKKSKVFISRNNKHVLLLNSLQ